VNIYVSNLAWATTEDELSHLFEAYGVIESVRIITDRATGRSRGFAFVEMPNAIQARVAIADLQGMELGGRTLRVQEARPRDEHDSGRRDPRPQRRPRW
jgi:RNA recognition motif-containing protein